MDSTGTRRPSVTAARRQARRDPPTCSRLIGSPVNGATKRRNSLASRSSRPARSIVGMPGLSIGTIPLVTVFTCQNLFIETLSQICDRERPTAACLRQNYSTLGPHHRRLGLEPGIEEWFVVL